MVLRASQTGLEVDPISRIEGHLGVKVNTDASGNINEAWVHGNLFRGFENFLVGREANDPITYTQRICGVCPVPHALTATSAADAVLGYSKGYVTFKDDGTYGVPEKALHLRNLALACDNLMSSITHFYHLAAPSYIQGPGMAPWTPWFDESYYNGALQNPPAASGELTPRALPVVLDDVDGGFSKDTWSAVITQYVKALRIRRLIFEASALFVGRAPMTSNFVAGGVTNDQGDSDFAAKCSKFSAIMGEVAEFVAKEYVPVALALSALYPAYDNVNNGGGGIGAGLGQFLSWGSHPQADDTMLLPGGHMDAGGTPVTWMSGKADLDYAIQLVKDNLTESIYSSRYANYGDEFETIAGIELSAFPGDVTRTQPDRNGNTNGYTYMKAPRWMGKPREVGPLARLSIAGLIQNNVTLASTVAVPGLAGYTAYVKTVNGVTGIDPDMVAPDIAVALVRDGLATLTLWDGTTTVVVDATVIASFDKATIVAAYTSASIYGEAVITGTVANHILGLKGGFSTMDRIRARALETLVLIQAVAGPAGTWTGGWIDQLAALGAGPTYISKPVPAGVRKGFGCVEAPRGSLAHFSTINNGKITSYQCVVPYTWNGSPRDSAGQRGPTEQAMIGAPFDDAGAEFTTVGNVTTPTAGGIEVLRVAQSFDPCIACAVH
ncbi:MAG: nickel-dependent hydrogenase large subunit [Coriobacteriia bacterium]|nr:nickel-dependent hydrogenase large subunit [Coriobacteriia bacterium]